MACSKRAPSENYSCSLMISRHIFPDNINITSNPNEEMMADLLILVKRLHQQLGLTQAQFARDLGVTWSAVNQGDLLGGLPNLYPGSVSRKWRPLGEGFLRHLSKQEARAFKQRWGAVNAADRQDSTSTLLAQKLSPMRGVAGVGQATEVASVSGGK